MKLEDVYVGQRVRIRSWDDMAAEFGIDDSWPSEPEIDCTHSFIGEMAVLCGNEYTVEKIEFATNRIGLCDSDEDPFNAVSEYAISSDMLEPAESVPDPVDINADELFGVLNI